MITFTETVLRKYLVTLESGKPGETISAEVEAHGYQTDRETYFLEFTKDGQVVSSFASHIVRSIVVMPDGN